MAVGLVLLLAGWPGAARGEAPVEDELARVGTVSITKASFDRWLAQATHSEFGRAVKLVGPRFRRCVSALGDRRAAKGWRRLGRDELKARCRQTRLRLRRQVLQFLVQAQWVEQEATARGVAVGDRQVDRMFKRQRNLAFPGRRGFRRFLRETGTNPEAIKYRIRLDALQRRIVRRVMAAVEPVTARDVARFRARNRARLRGLPRARAERIARRILVAEREQATLAEFARDFRSRYRAITWCAGSPTIAECGATAPQDVASEEGSAVRQASSATPLIGPSRPALDR